MALAIKRQPLVDTSPSHRSWRDPNGTTSVHCTQAGEKRLMQLSAQADRIVLREAPGRTCDPRTVDQIIDKLKAANLLLSGAVQHPELALKRLRIILGDRLARTRIVDGRHALAGLARFGTGDGSETVLLVVLASRQVSSCDWLLKPDA
jgi:hypothetical protein